jgi:hypothetical protein
MVEHITLNECKAISKMLNSYLYKEMGLIEKSPMLHLMVNFSNRKIDSIATNIRLDDIKNMKGCVHTLILVMPVTLNQFVTISNFQSTLKNSKMELHKLIFIERRIPKVEEWIRTDMPIFHKLAIYDVFDCIKNLCRIEWTMA